MPFDENSIHISEIRDKTVVGFTSGPSILWWDFEKIDEVRAELYALEETHGRSVVVVDFEGVVGTLPAAFEGVLVGLHRRLERAGGVLTLCRLPLEIQEQFQLNSLARVFRIVVTREEALA